MLGTIVGPSPQDDSMNEHAGFQCPADSQAVTHSIRWRRRGDGKGMYNNQWATMRKLSMII